MLPNKYSRTICCRIPSNLVLIHDFISFNFLFFVARSKFKVNLIIWFSLIVLMIFKCLDCHLFLRNYYLCCVVAHNHVMSQKSVICEAKICFSKFSENFAFERIFFVDKRTLIWIMQKGYITYICNPIV